MPLYLCLNLRSVPRRLGSCCSIERDTFKTWFGAALCGMAAARAAH